MLLLALLLFLLLCFVGRPVRDTGATRFLERRENLRLGPDSLFHAFRLLLLLIHRCIGLILLIFGGCCVPFCGSLFNQGGCVEFLPGRYCCDEDACTCIGVRGNCGQVLRDFLLVQVAPARNALIHIVDLYSVLDQSSLVLNDLDQVLP